LAAVKNVVDRRKGLNMTLATIMVAVDFDQASNSRISLAAEMAARLKSLLIGVAGWPLLKHRPEKRLRNWNSKHWIPRIGIERA
jgi:hypothetical protein